MSESDKRLENLSPLKRALVAVEEMRKKLQKLQNEKHEPIAVIGLGCRFPKANNPLEFWNLLTDGTDAISEIPKERWDVEKFYDPDPGKQGKMITRSGGFINDIDKFDPQFFGISPREADSMDPQQRMLLEIVWEAIEFAGIKPSSLRKSKTGVFIGISNNDYTKLPKDRLKVIDPYSGSGNAFSIASNRISYLYDFRGPSIAIDTACSSSLVSIHLAIQSLRNRESDLAIAGGVNLILSPELTITFSQAHMMSPSGHCNTFSDNADGYVRGEGGGVVLLKRLSEALKDGDNILSVIRGSAVNQDGKSNGLTAPNSFAQKKVITEALENAKVEPDEIQFIETHGTGTILGDPIEVQALGMVMEGRSKENLCYLGAVKTNLGHLESAAGIAGFIKTVMSLYFKKIPANLNFNKINPHIPIDELPFVVPEKTIDWQKLDGLRKAGVSSFGFGGTNAHIVLEEFNQIEFVKNEVERTNQITCFSAKSSFSLIENIKKHIVFINENKHIEFGDYAYNINANREHFDKRTYFIANDFDELLEELDNFLVDPNEFVSAVPSDEPAKSKIAFLFTGQGSQYFGMGKVLFNSSPTFRKNLEECDRFLKPIIKQSIIDLLFLDESKSDLINQTAFTQPLLFSIEYSIAKLWMSWGVTPDYLVGHSVGEYAAACISGIMNLEDALKLIAKRGELMQLLPKNGDMAVVFKDYEFVYNLIKKIEDRVSIAGVNGPENTVISGEKIYINNVLDELKSKGIEFRKLTVSHAFHSPLMEPIIEEFESFAKDFSFNSPQIPIISNLTGEVISKDNSIDAKYLSDHIRKPVLYEPGIRRLNEQGCNVFIEIGPNPTLIGMAKRIISNNNFLWLPSLKRKHDDWEVLLKSIGELYLKGFEFNWETFESDYKRNFLLIPTYQFMKERHWFANADKKYSDDEQLNDEENKPTNDELKTSENYKKIKAKLFGLSSDKQYDFLIEIITSEISRVLRLSKRRIDINKSLMHLGLDSIMAMELNSKLNIILEFSIPVAKLIEGPTIQELASYIFKRINTKSETIYPKVLRKGSDSGEFPLSYGQKAMWFQHQMAPESIFNPSYAARIKSAVDVELLRKSFEIEFERHPQLRTNFKLLNGSPIQFVNKNSKLFFYYENLENLNIEEVKQRLHNEAKVKFDLENDQLFKIFLYKLGEQDYIVQLVSHHIISDMWSQAILVSEVDKLYNSRADNNSLISTQYHYTDYVVWQSELLESKTGNKIWNYWKENLKGELPVLELPVDNPRPSVQTFNGLSKTIILDEDLTEKIKKLSIQANSTQFVTLLTAFNILINKYSGQNDIIVGTPTTGRSLPEFENIVGYFVNPVAIRTQLDKNLTFNEYLKKVQNASINAIDHQDYPFNLIVEKLQPVRDPSRTPIFQVMFVYQKAHLLNDEGLTGLAIGEEGLSMKLGGLPIEAVKIEDGKAPFDLTLMMAETERGLGATFTYNTELFNGNTIDRMMHHFKVILRQVTENSDILLSKVDLLSKTDKELIINNWNDTFVPQLSFNNVVTWFEHQVEITPNKFALVFGEKTLTYFELNQKVNQLAKYLINKGVEHDKLVGICLDRSFNMIISLLAVLKAGGAYVPIDCYYPNERIKYIINDSSIDLLITSESNIDSFRANNIELIVLERVRDIINTEDVCNPNVKINTNGLAYSIYTSGSTGKPKGVLLTHGSLINLAYAQIQKFEITSDSRVLQFASFSFDASISEIFTTLLSGAELHLIKAEDLISVSALLNKLKTDKITTCTLPPSILNALPEEELVDLKVLVSAGEECTSEIYSKWGKNRTFINAYGPTESTICASCNKISNTEISKIPIGKPIDNIQIYILDREYNIVPVGVPGEIYISGKGLARGYRNKPDLTAEKFLPNPFAEIIGSRMYKTGDLGKYLPDGKIIFLGRIDNQVKFRGYRIELSEIENQLIKHPAVKQTVVVSKKSKSGEQRLIAYYVTLNGTNGIDLELRTFLKKSLPDYMIPGFFVNIKEIPLTTNGKINRKALPEPDLSRRAKLNTNARTETEKVIASIWEEVLGIANISIEDNFFELGGHSLSVIQVQTKIKELLGKELSVVDLFKYPTVKTFANYLSDEKDEMESFETKKERINKQKNILALQQKRMKIHGRTK